MMITRLGSTALKCYSVLMTVDQDLYHELGMGQLKKFLYHNLGA